MLAHCYSFEVKVGVRDSRTKISACSAQHKYEGKFWRETDNLLRLSEALIKNAINGISVAPKASKPS